MRRCFFPFLFFFWWFQNWWGGQRGKETMTQFCHGVGGRKLKLKLWNWIFEMSLLWLNVHIKIWSHIIHCLSDVSWLKYPRIHKQCPEDHTDAGTQLLCRFLPPPRRGGLLKSQPLNPTKSHFIIHPPFLQTLSFWRWTLWIQQTWWGGHKTHQFSVISKNINIKYSTWEHPY